MKICIHGRYLNDESLKLLRRILQESRQNKFEFAFTESFHGIAKEFLNEVADFNMVKSKNDLAKYDILLSLGGDGTLLETVSITGRSNKKTGDTTHPDGHSRLTMSRTVFFRNNIRR